MLLRARWLVFGPLVGLLGACLPAFAPGIRTVDHHIGMTASSPNDVCMGCHESEQAVLEVFTAMAPAEREHAMHERMEGGGASLVAQWMIDDPRTCASCHEPKGAR